MPNEYTITKLRGGLALSYWRDGKRCRHALGTADKGEADRLAPALFAELTRPRGNTVAAIWAAYQDDMKGRAITGTMVHTWKALRERFGALPGDAITIADCRAHTEARRAAGIKDGTIITELGHMRIVLLWGEKHKLIGRASAIERPPKPKPVEKHLTHAEVRRLIEASELPHLKLFVHLAYATAGRASALLGLTWDRCNFARGKIDLEDAGIGRPHKGRAIVPMTRTLRAALQDARAGALSPYVIEWGGARVLSVKKGLWSAGRRARIEKVTPHMIRHSAAVRMAEQGVPMEEIASYLGHSNTTVTRQVYARFSPEHLRGAAASLEMDEVQEVRLRVV